MTVRAGYATQTYLCDGTTTEFPVPFKFYDDEVRVYKNKTKYVYQKGVDYTITGSGEPNGGMVVFNTPPRATEYITIARDVILQQLVTFIEGEAFPANDYEYSLDRIVMALQALSEEFAQVVSLPMGMTYQEWFGALIKWADDTYDLTYEQNKTYQKGELAASSLGLYICRKDDVKGVDFSHADTWLFVAPRRKTGVWGKDEQEKGELTFFPLKQENTVYMLEGGDYRHYEVANVATVKLPTLNAETGVMTVPGGVDGYYNKSEIDSNFYTKSAIDANFCTETAINNNFYAKTEADDLFYSKSNWWESVKKKCDWAYGHYPLEGGELRENYSGPYKYKIQGQSGENLIPDVIDEAEISAVVSFEDDAVTESGIFAPYCDVMSTVNTSEDGTRSVSFQVYLYCKEILEEPVYCDFQYHLYARRQ